MSDNIIAINVPNIVTIGVMFLLFVTTIHVIVSVVKGKPIMSAGGSDA